MNYDKAILIENFYYVSPIHVCVFLICDVLHTQLYNHHTYDVSQRLFQIVLISLRIVTFLHGELRNSITNLVRVRRVGVTAERK